MPGAAPLPLVALGDSITNGGGVRTYGVPCRSWAAWLAEALELPFRCLAEDGAAAAGVLARQVPRLPERARVGCLYVGVNDARSPQFDAAAFEQAFDEALAALAARADHTLAATVPVDLGRPLARGVSEANRAIEASAGRHGAALARLDGFGGARHVMPDHVHPTALGQLAIADAAADALAGHGVEVPRRPSSLAAPATGPAAGLAFNAARGWHVARDVARRTLERRRFG